MKIPFMVVFVLWALLMDMAIPTSKANLATTASQYCSDRFHFCLDYPSSLFPEQFFSPDGDSVLMKTGGQVAEISVMGTLGGSKLAPEQVFQKNIESITSNGSKPTIISSLFGEKDFEVNFLLNGFSYHQKAGFFSDAYVLFTVKAPVNRPELMVRLKENVRMVFD